MNNNIKKGKLKRWDDSKGFGFVSLPSGGSDIFLHISALKQATRRPTVGDMISYQVHTDNNGKSRAVNASIDGLPVSASRSPVKPTKQKKTMSLFSQAMVVCLIALAGLFAYRLVIDKSMANEKSTSAIQSALPVAMKPVTRSLYSCDGKTHCSQMTSCAEAKFYQRHCPGTKMDGDGDGVPCESQWCSRW